MMVNILLTKIIIIIFGVQASDCHGGHHDGLLSSLHMSKHEAYSFLRDKRSPGCQNEQYCETHMPQCRAENERTREQLCAQSNPCSNGFTCIVEPPCPKHRVLRCTADACMSFPCCNSGTCIATVSSSYYCACIPGYDSNTDCCTETNECASNPCQHGGQCHDHFNRYSCTCQPGYTGVNCETDINECASLPCLNGGSCNDLINHFVCDCAPRYIGTVCEKDCRPGPADILFVLDVSDSANVNKTFDYVRSFISQIPIGPRDFQVGLITYSFDAVLEFSLNTYMTNESLLEGINNVKGGARGPTYTGQALQLARQILTSRANGARDITVRKYIVLLNDGMSTDRSVAYQEATFLKYSSITLMTVGVGTYIDHKELYRLAGESKYMFSSTNTNALNTILVETSNADCIDCTENDMVDIVFVVDVSATQILQQYITRMKQIVRLLQTDSHDINYGVVSYSSSPSIEFELGSYSHDQVMARLSRILPNQGIPNQITALNFTRHNTYTNSRVGAQKIAVFLSHVGRDWEDVDGVKAQVQLLEQDGIKVMLIGEGDEFDDKLSGVSTDSYRAIYTTSNSDDVDRLFGILTEGRHIQCDPDVFILRQ